MAEGVVPVLPYFPPLESPQTGIAPSTELGEAPFLRLSFIMGSPFPRLSFSMGSPFPRLSFIVFLDEWNSNDARFFLHASWRDRLQNKHIVLNDS